MAVVHLPISCTSSMVCWVTPWSCCLDGNREKDVCVCVLKFLIHSGLVVCCLLGWLLLPAQLLWNSDEIVIIINYYYYYYYSLRWFIHRSLSGGHVPSYLADDYRLVTDAGVRRLRSADSRTLVVGRTQSSFGDRTFAAAAPRLWNTLQSDIRQPDLFYGLFRRHLRHFFLGNRATPQCDLC